MKALVTICAVAGVILAATVVWAAEPSSDTPGAWIIYPDSSEHWVGDDRYSSSYGSDLSTSIHNALGYSGAYIAGPDSDPTYNNILGYWETYSPPPSGSIIELRGPGDTWSIGGDNAQGGAGKHKMKSLVLQQDGITIRGQSYDDGSGNMVQQQILFNNGATTALLYCEARDLRLQNLHICGTWPDNSGGYAVAVGRYTMIGDDPTAPGLIVRDITFENLRAPFDQQPTVEDLTLTDNTFTDCYYNIFKKGVTFEGDCVITNNVFNCIGEGKTYPNLQILDSNGSALIDNNTFNGWAPGQYAIEIEVDISDHPIILGGNDVFVDQLGGSGAAYELYPLVSGGHAVGAVNEGSIIPEPTTLGLLAVGGVLALIRRRRK